LKGENNGQPVDLQQRESVQLLGFELFKSREQLGIKQGAGAWGNIKKNLMKAHETNRPSAAARAAIDGWIDSYGPAFRMRQTRNVAYLLRLGAELGFRELGDPDHYVGRCAGAYQRWRSLVNDPKAIGMLASN
jgi:hypothetical protein